VLELTFIAGRPKETRLALLKELNARIAAGTGISPDDLMIQLVEVPGEKHLFRPGTGATRLHLKGSLKPDRYEAPTMWLLLIPMWDCSGCRSTTSVNRQFSGSVLYWYQLAWVPLTAH